MLIKRAIISGNEGNDFSLTVNMVYIVYATPMVIVGLFPSYGQLVSDAFREIGRLGEAVK